MHRQTFDLRIEAGAFGNRPALQCAFDLKAKIVVQARGVMLLNAELQRMVGLWRFSRTFLGAYRRFRGGVEVPFLLYSSSESVMAKPSAY